MRVVDAYAGIGGWSAGAQQAGCTPVLGVDSDEQPLRTWATNLPSARAACATLGTDAVDWPAADPDVHAHFSPPCSSLSKARAGRASPSEVSAALGAVRWCLDLVLERGYASFSLENVATPALVSLLAEYARRHPSRVAHVVLDAADYGVASNRARLIASTPAVIQRLKEMPVTRVSVAEAFAAAGLPLPAKFLKSNTTNRDGSPCVRSVQQPAFTVTASHPLVWCSRAGVTKRCLTVAESAVLMGFAREWALPAGARAGLRAVGNAVPPPLAAAVMRAALDASPAHAGPPPPASPLASRPRSKRSLQAVADAAAGSDVDSEASEGSEASEASVAALLALLGSLQTSVRRLKRRVHALERGAAA